MLYDWLKYLGWCFCVEFICRCPIFPYQDGTICVGVISLYSETTKSIRITVVPSFLDEHSSPDDSRYVWAYEVKIENLGQETVQLINRHWSITNSLGQTQTVRGPGVVGEQPVLKPGEYFEYTSGTPLNTPSGLMSGIYQMEGKNGQLFDVSIPVFSLDSPHQPMQVN